MNISEIQRQEYEKAVRIITMLITEGICLSTICDVLNRELTSVYDWGGNTSTGAHHVEVNVDRGNWITIWGGPFK